MAEHPRLAASAARNPRPTEIRAARENAGLTANAAAMMLHTTTRVWQQWEAGDRRMHPAFWELFRIKVGTLEALRAPPAAGKA